MGYFYFISIPCFSNFSTCSFSIEHVLLYITKKPPLILHILSLNQLKVYVQTQNDSNNGLKIPE